MIKSTVKRLFTPRTKFVRNDIRNEKQFETNQKIQNLENTALEIGLSMKEIDDTKADSNSDSPNSVYGEVKNGSAGYPQNFKGYAQLDETANPNTLDVTSDSGDTSTRLEVKTSGEKKTIHKTKSVNGPDGSSLISHEWAIVDGNKASFQEYSYFS